MKCSAYIDPKTGIALEGEALVNASKNSHAPRCGYELEPGDMFCPSCGAKGKECLAQSQNAFNPEPKTQRQKRATRMEYWLTMLVLVVINFFINLFCQHLSRNFTYSIGGTWHGEHYFWLFWQLLGIGTYVYFVRVCVKRLHDMNLSGWLAVPIVVCPIGMCVIYVISALSSHESATWKVINLTLGAVYLGMLLWMGFKRGTAGPNKYGSVSLA